MSRIPSHGARRRPFPVASAVALATSIVLTACGGGGGGTSSDTAGATSSSAAGTITGFGSVITNGVRYELSGTAVVDEGAGTSISCSDNTSNCGLKLGMEVEIEGDGVRASSDGTTLTSVARSIHVGSSIRGPVASVAADGNSLIVLGQTIALTTSTRFEDGVQPVAGDIVEVHGLIDSSVTPSQISASLVEVKTAAVSSYRLRGSLDKVAGTVGGEPVSFATLAGEDLTRYQAATDGLIVRVKLSTTPDAQGQWVALSFRSGERTYSHVDDGKHTEHEGFIESIVTRPAEGATGTVVTGFVVNGNTVSLPEGFSSYEGGTVAQLVVGARVEVEGTVVDGVLVASKIEFKKARKRSERGHGDDAHTHAQEFELHGTLAPGSAPNTLVVRGLTFDLSDATAVRLPAGITLETVMDWARQGKSVEVKGYLMADGNTYQLTSIKLDGRSSTSTRT